MTLKFTLLFVWLLLTKWLSDISRNRWERSWLSEIGWLDAWKNAPVPFDLWHILQGLLYMIPLWMLLWYWLDHQCIWFMEMEKGEQRPILDWSYKNYLIFIGLCILIWAVFYGLFTLGYHYFLMRGEWWGS